MSISYDDNHYTTSNFFDYTTLSINKITKTLKNGQKAASFPLSRNVISKLFETIKEKL